MSIDTATVSAWDGAFNVRDLGGLPLADGRTTAYRRVFRSGAPEYLTSRGWRAAASIGLTTVVDLRNAPRETGREAYHPRVDETALAGIDILNRPTENPDDDDFMRVCGPWLDHPRSYADNLAFFPPKFAAVFAAIDEAPGGVLVHCAGGRDRTGMIVAMLLSLTGVDHGAIVDDYEAAFRGVNAFIAEHPEVGREPVRTAEEMDVRVAERRTALADWLAGLDVAAYLTDAGLGVVAIDRLRARLVAA